MAESSGGGTALGIGTLLSGSSASIYPFQNWRGSVLNPPPTEDRGKGGVIPIQTGARRVHCIDVLRVVREDELIPLCVSEERWDERALCRGEYVQVQDVEARLALYGHAQELHGEPDERARDVEAAVPSEGVHELKHEVSEAAGGHRKADTGKRTRV